MAFELALTCIIIKWYTKFQLNISKHVGEKCGKLWRTDGRTDGRTETRTDGRTDGHHHTIIRSIWRRAYKNLVRWNRCQSGGKFTHRLCRVSYGRKVLQVQRWIGLSSIVMVRRKPSTLPSSSVLDVRQNGWGSIFWKNEAQGATYRAPEYNVPPLWEIGQGGNFYLLIGPKNANFVEDIDILLTVKFRWIPFSGFRGEVENVSANQRPGRPSCFFDQPEKHKLGRGRWDLASCQVSLNSLQRFQRRSRKCLSQSEARAAILFFRSARKTQTW